MNYFKFKKMKIDASLLKAGYSTAQKEGFSAEFYTSGRLSHFGYYTNGKPKGWVLMLAQGSLNAQVEIFRGGKNIVISYPQGFAPTEKRRMSEESTEEERFYHWIKSYIKQYA